MRVVQGLYVLKLAAQYALLETVPFSVTTADLTGYGSYAILTTKQANIQTALMGGIQVGACTCLADTLDNAMLAGPLLGQGGIAILCIQAWRKCLLRRKVIKCLTLRSQPSPSCRAPTACKPTTCPM